MGAYKQENDLRWWRFEGDQLASSVHQTITQMSTTQSYRREATWRYARMYGNYVGFGAQGSPILRTGLGAGSFRLSLNVIKNMCGAATAKVTKVRPKPMFLTSGGDYTEQRKAKQLTKFAEGQFYEVDLYQVAPTVFLDACIYGTGVMKIYQETEDIRCERVFPWEILVDEADGRDCRPRQMYQVARMDKLVLCELYPEHEDKIMNAPQSPSFDYETGDSSIIGYLSNLITVREAWHLPSGKDATDGRHVLTIEGAVLLDEPYTRDYFPFAFVRWSKSPIGFWGIGLAEELTGIQIEINTLLRSIQQAHHLMGKSHWMVENSSKVLSTHLDNEIGTIIKYTGMPPQVYVPGAVAPEIYKHLWELYQRAYEIAGISQLSAQSQKPSGLDSGKALRTFVDIQTERFVVVAREYEAFFLETARQMIELAREISAANPDYQVKVEGKRSVEKIKWSDVNLKEEEYIMKAYPVNALSDDPESRMEQVNEMMDRGTITPEVGMRLLDFPDLQRQLDGMFSSQELMSDWLEDMIDKGEYNPPEPLMNLEQAIKTVQDAYLYYRRMKVPQENLDLLLKFISEAMALMQPEEPPMPPAMPEAPPGMMPPDMMGAGAPPMMPGAPPMMPPPQAPMMPPA